MRINLNRKIARRADGFSFANVRKGKIDVVCVCQCGSVAKYSLKIYSVKFISSMRGAAYFTGTNRTSEIVFSNYNLSSL